MTQKISNQFQNLPHSQMTDMELGALLGGSLNSRYSKIKRLVEQGKLLHIRRGLYCLTKEFGYTKKPHPFELAQFIYGPSYISLESALSYHQLIPEAVYTITSACSKRSKEFQTPIGVFSFSHLPSDSLYTEVDLVNSSEVQFFIAKPWKAICDYVFCYKKDWTNMEPLFESLRIDEEDLPELLYNEREILNDYYKNTRIKRFLKGVKIKL
ncbi:MAG: hypothetical protein V4591_01785 [Bdellovibrionota bacterium]